MAEFLESNNKVEDLSRYASHDPDLVPVSRYLGIEHLGDLPDRDQGRIETILNWIRLKVGQDRVDILTGLRNIERQLDPPPIGVSRLDQLYQWIRLELDQQKILQAKESMMKHA